MDLDKLVFNVAAFVAGLFVLEFGADKFVDHTATVARRLGVSQTLVALLTAGAEWEELAVVIAAVAQKKPSLALGNVIGSTVSNILGAFSLGLLFTSGPNTFDRSSRVYSALLLALTTAVVPILWFVKGPTANKIAGALLVAAFVLYAVSVGVAIYKGALAPPEGSDSDSADSDSEDSDDGVSDRSSDSDNPRPAHPNGHAPTETSALLSPPKHPHSRPRPRPRSLIYHILQLALGFAALSLSGYILSHTAIAITTSLNLSGTVFGITILSFATTLPEKLVAVVSARRGYGGIVVANTAGSNVFLLTLCLGVVGLSGGEGMAGGVVPFELAVTWVSAALFCAIVYGNLGRWAGAVLLAAYVAFIVLEFTLFRRQGGR
ncbi:hypothetical protein B0A49_04477 [Cryomyces minteri]|uniref:Sodium/calcium exchanger membrane region domain-containing protein n=1 Tax=Cryomyces minteri TaxID=331657 RepID=A0A4U0X1Q8_9PEZI|nr:hypothetical protein B0A49_04477 [Cryomyces minteri]